MLATSIFFFSHNVFKRLFPPVRQKSSLCGNGITKQSRLLTTLRKKPFENIVGKGKKMLATKERSDYLSNLEFVVCEYFGFCPVQITVVW